MWAPPNGARNVIGLRPAVRRVVGSDEGDAVVIGSGPNGLVAANTLAPTAGMCWCWKRPAALVARCPPARSPYPAS